MKNVETDKPSLQRRLMLFVIYPLPDNQRILKYILT